MAPFGTVALVGAGVTLDRFPYLQNVSGDSATLMWTTRQPGAGSVAFSTDTSFSSRVQASVRQFKPGDTGRPFTYYQYEARLTGLRPGAQYLYRILDSDGQNLTPAGSPADELRFRTAAPGPMSFLVIGDSGEGSAQQAQLATALAQENNASLLVHTGDVAYPSGTIETYEAFFFAVYRDVFSRLPVFTVPGNHDYYVANGTPYKQIVSPSTANVPDEGKGLYYSFDWGDVHFIALDTNDPLSRAILGTGSMLDWLERDLQTTRKFWRIAFFHHPPYPTSSHHENDEISATVREYVVPIFDRYGVPLVLGGHDHNYQREVPLKGGVPVAPGVGTQYIITGGGGAGLFSLNTPGSPIVTAGVTDWHYLRVDIDGAKATVRATSVGGKEIDRVVVGPLPAVSDAGVVNAASSQGTLAPGSLVTVYGRNLAYRDEQASTIPLPAQLSGIKLSVGGQALPLVFVSPGQVNAQVPFTVFGYVTLTVANDNGSAQVNMSVNDTAPGIFDGPAVIHNATFKLVTAANPAAPGEFIAIYATGLGGVDGTIAAGAPAPSTTLLRVTNPVQVQLGTSSLTPTFAGLAPGFAGLYQVVVQIPSSLRSGAYGLQLVAKGVSSNSVNIPVGTTSNQARDEGRGEKAELASLLRRLAVVPA